MRAEGFRLMKNMCYREYRSDVGISALMDHFEAWLKGC